MNNLIGGIQTVLGIFTVNTAISLITQVNRGGLHLLSSSSSLTALIILGSAIAAVAIFQFFRRLRFALIQLLLGLVILAASVFLYFSHAAGVSLYTGLGYLVIVCAGLTVVAVFMQFFIGGLRNEPGY